MNGPEKNAAIFGGPWGTSSDYYATGALKSFYLANGAFLEHRYDPAERMNSRLLRSSDGGVLSAWDEVSYDENDHRVLEVVAQRQADGNSPSSTGSFSYDAVDRLSSSKHPFEADEISYTLDNAGNVVSEGELFSWFWGNRLTSTNLGPDGPAVATYSYSHFGNQTEEINPEGTLCSDRGRRVPRSGAREHSSRL